jgi:hypothetical protein
VYVQVSQMMLVGDKDGDGFIDFDEFKVPRRRARVHPGP